MTKEKLKTLKDKRKELLRAIQEAQPELTMTFGFLFRDIEKQDKEFIRLLKEEFDKFCGEKAITKDFTIIIDKLTGDLE